MNGRRFASKRARILKNGRPERTQRRAIEHLAREAGAEPVFAGRKLIGHAMPTGTFICELRRYSSEEAAVGELDQVHAFRHLTSRPVPVRPFFCGRCYGWHVSKRA